MPLVTIIVPVFNTERYLRYCLDSLLQQTMKELEIICVNDGSTDHSLQILEEYAARDVRIRLFTKENSGYGDSMNLGLSHANGEYIGIVESDDYVLPNMIEHLYNVAHNYDAEITKSNFYYASEANGEVYQENLSELPYNQVFTPIENRKIFGVMPTIWSGLYKTSFLKEHNILFNPSPGASFQDISFCFRVLLSAKKMICVPEAYICYRCDNENSSVKSPKKVFCIVDEFQNIKNYVYEKKKDFIMPVIEPEKFIYYMQTYVRIDPIYQYAFFREIKRELMQDYEAGLMDRQYWPEDKWNLMQQITQNGDDFFESTNIEYLNRYVFKDYTINQDLSILGTKCILEKAEKVIIYGSGIYGRSILNKVLKIKQIYAFAVTEIHNSDSKEIMGIPVYEIKDLQEYKNEAVIIVAMKKSNQLPVLMLLKELGFNKVISVDKI